MTYTHKNTGTCSSQVTFEVIDEIITKVTFKGGCSGNAQGISILAEGRNAREIAAMIKGIHCGYKKTSCPDQLSRAIEEALGS